MAGPLDNQVGFAVESTYGTAVTPTVFAEQDNGNTNHEWDPKPIQGTGMQVGDGGFDRADRSVAVVGQGKGQLGLDVVPRAMGKLWNGIFGTGASTLVSGTTYQHVFTSGLTASLLPALTMQYGVVRSDVAGTVDAYTYAGTTLNKLTLTQAVQDVLKAVFEWDAKSQTKATALATAAYTNTATPFHYGHWALTFGGAVTNPTATALATGGTAATNLKSFTLEIDNKADLERWVAGASRNQPRVAKRAATLRISAEYDSVTYDDAMVNHSTNAVTATWTHTDPLSTGFSTVQFTFPACKVIAGARPSPSNETPVTELSLEIKKPTAGHAIYLAVRTADVTL